MMPHSNFFAVSKHHTKRQVNALLPSLSPLTAPAGSSTLPTSSNTPTDPTSTSAASGTTKNSPDSTTGNGPATAGNGLTAGNGATGGNGPVASDGLTAASQAANGPPAAAAPAAAAGPGSATVPDPTTVTGSTASTDPTKGSGSKAASGTTTGPGSTTGNTDSGATSSTTKSGSVNSNSSPLISVNSPNLPSNQSTTPASQAPKASSNGVANTPIAASLVANQSSPSVSPSLTTGATANNPAGVAVTQGLYPSAKPAGTNSNVVTPVSASRSSATPAGSDDNTGTSVGTIMGILVAGLIGAVILVGVVGMFFKRKKRRMNSDFDDNPFLNDKYGTDADVGGSPSVDSHGLARSASGTNRAGGATGPRPPSILERHWGAPSLPPPPPAFQPGQNYSASPFASPSQMNTAHNPPLSQQNGGHAAEHPGYSDGGHEVENSIYGGHHPGPPSSHPPYGGEVQSANFSNIQRQLSLTSQGSPPSFEPHAYGHASKDDSKEVYTAQVAQMDFFGGGRLKNPYDCDETIRSGTPIQPNIQQSYFAHSYPDYFTSSPDVTRQIQPRETRDQRTLSVINGHPSTPAGIPLTI